MNRIDLFQIAKNAIPTEWGALAHNGMKVVLQYTNPPIPLALIYNELIFGQLMLWSVKRDGNPIGFITTNPYVLPYAALGDPTLPIYVSRLQIAQAYSFGDTHQVDIEDCITHPALIQAARRIHATHLSFFSLRDRDTTKSAWERKLEKFNPERGYTEILIPIPKGD